MTDLRQDLQVDHRQDLRAFIEAFQDHLAPKLETYEQVLYLYTFRHTRLIGQHGAIIGFKSARRTMVTGIGENGHPMSENTCYTKLGSLIKSGSSLYTS